MRITHLVPRFSVSLALSMALLVAGQGHAVARSPGPDTVTVTSAPAAPRNPTAVAYQARRTITPVREGVPGATYRVHEASSPVFTGDYDTGDFRQWETCQWRGYNDDCAGWAQGSYQARVVDGGPGHETAARFEVRDGDVPQFGGGERAEVSAGDLAGPAVREGDERWYDFSLRFDESFRNPRGEWFIVMQWHAGSGSPPLALQVTGDGVLTFSNDRNGKTTPIGAIQRGRWVDYRLHVKFSKGAGAFAESWVGGAKQPGVHREPNMASASNYLKMGIYRDGDDSGTAVVWQDGLKISTS